MKRSLILLALLAGCVEECPAGTSLRWTPEPDMDDLRACHASREGKYFCMQDMGYRKVCR